MARVFNLVVFDQTISGDSGTPRIFYTSQEHAALLGSVERLQVQVILRGASSFAATAEVTYQITNSPEYETWTDTSKKVTTTATTIAEIPKIVLFQVTSLADQAAFGRFMIETHTDNLMQLQVVVSGYAD